MGKVICDEFRQTPEGIVFIPQRSLSEPSQLLGRELEVIEVRGNMIVAGIHLELPVCRRITGCLTLRNASLTAPAMNHVMSSVDLYASQLFAPQLLGDFHLSMTTTSEFTAPRILRSLDIIQPVGMGQPLRMPNLIVVANAINGYTEGPEINTGFVELIAPRLRLVGRTANSVKLTCPPLDPDSNRGFIRRDLSHERLKLWQNRIIAIETAKHEALEELGESGADRGLLL